MSILVGYPLNRRGRNALSLGVMLARSAAEDLVVCTVVPWAWLPKGVKVDAEYHAHIQDAARSALDQARADLPDDVSATFVTHPARSAPSGLLEMAEEHNATVIVLGSSTAGMFGHVTLSTVSDRLLHSSPVPVALAPRGFRAGLDEQLTRVTVAYGGTEAADDLVSAVRMVVLPTSATMRVASFAVAPAPPDTAMLRHEAEQIVDEWSTSVRAAADAALADLADIAARTPGSEPVEVVVGRGEDWSEALEDIDWGPGDVLVVGSSSYGPIARVFLGSHAAKIIRHAPVPVVVVPRHVLSDAARGS